MKKNPLYVIAVIMAILMTIGILFVPQSLSLAQTVSPTKTAGTPTKPAVQITPTVFNLSNVVATPSSEQLAKGENVTFSTLGYSDTTLYGPYGSFYADVSIPANWKLLPGAKVRLNLTLNVVKPVDPKSAWLGPTIYVYFDDIYIASHLLGGNGQYSFDVALPSSQLVEKTDGNHSLYVYMDATYDCNYDQSTVLVIQSDSYFNFDHLEDRVIPNISQLPNPYYQEYSFLKNQEYIVIPDKPTDSELQAALIVAAGFGRMSGGGINFTTIPVSQLTDTIEKSSHLIFVGKASSLPVLKTLKLPSTTDGTKFNVSGMADNDGILQVSASDWNQAKALLVVSGKTDEGVLKAAQTLSSGTVRSAPNTKVAVIANVNTSTANQQTIPVDQTFKSMGYQNINLTGLGVRTQNYLFSLPSGYKIGSDAYVDLYFSASQLLDYNRSSVSVILNGNRIKDVSYADVVANSMVKPAHVELPAYAFVAGTNRLTVEATHTVDHCTYTDTTILWTTVMSNSVLHLPKSTEVQPASDIEDLAIYPKPFSDAQDLSNVAFVVAPNDLDALDVAGKLATNLGSQTSSDIINLTAYSSATTPAAIKQAKNVIVIGKPAELPMVAELASAMPAPFAAGQNLAEEGNLRVIYRLPSDSSIGYLELFPAPWDPTATILTVLGSTSDGLKWAGNTLVDETQRASLAGNYAVTNGTSIFTADTSMGGGTENISATAVPAAVVTVTAAPTGAGIASISLNVQPQTASKPYVDPKIWIPYVVGGLTLVILIIIIIVLVMNSKHNKDSRYRIDQ
jgi:hypothetical protein